MAEDNDDEKQVEELLHRQWMNSPGHASWKITNEEFRRAYRSGEFEPKAKSD